MPSGTLFLDQKWMVLLTREMIAMKAIRLI